MSPLISRGFLRGSMACAAAALGLSFTALAHAQGYTDQDYGYDNGYDSASDVGGVTVIAPRRHQERTFSGAPIVNVSASRVVDTSDLDLSTGYGVHIMHQRIRNAAADACQELDSQWTRGLYPTADSSDADCYHRAVRNAMDEASDVAYTGY
ncbi:MAG TPA: UrcA family protein [Caulobacteraceae bacterium]|jgi:UrcA family protein